jgi:cell division protein FtsI/penicillin-binding protein 2
MHNFFKRLKVDSEHKKPMARKKILFFSTSFLFAAAAFAIIALRPGMATGDGAFASLGLASSAEEEKVDRFVAEMSVPEPILGPGGKYIQIVNGKKYTYTLDPELQAEAQAVLARYKVPYGAIVAIEPATGKVLAFAEYSQRDKSLKGLAQRATYPAASLIKVVTAAAALETGKVCADTVFTYEGSPYVLTKRKISPDNRKRERNITTLGEALGKSNNIVFGKLGVYCVGTEKMQQTTTDFGFNREIPFDFPLQPSTSVVPIESYDLAQTTAGFIGTKISPVHAALIAAAVSNNGVMMRPWMIESVTDESGKVVYTGTSSTLLTAVTPQIAEQLTGIMRNTVTQGTSSKIFKRHAKKLFENVAVSGKTGSLTGDDPPGKYEWFMGFAPEKNPQIAVAGMVINQGNPRQIHGAYAAMTVFKKHFGM